jgi:uncharacterized protein with HEPN domain
VIDLEVRILLVSMRDFGLEAAELRRQKPDDELLADRWSELAMLHLIQTIGECASKLDKIAPLWRKHVPDVPWASVVTMRHKIVHAYDNINDTMVLDVVDRGLPELTNALTRFLDTNP